MTSNSPALDRLQHIAKHTSLLSCMLSILVQSGQRLLFQGLLSIDIGLEQLLTMHVKAHGKDVFQPYV